MPLAPDPPAVFGPPFFGPSATAFVPWGLAHGLVLALATALFALVVRYARRGDARRRWRVGAVVGWLPFAVWATFNAARSVTGDWTRQVDLPLNLCPLMAFVLPFALAARRRGAFTLAYFAVLAGCVQALLTPNLLESFPHYEFVRYWLLHVSLVWAVLYAVVVHGDRPTLRGLGAASAALVGYVLVVDGLNRLLGTNYAFTRHKPETASVLDHLGPYPVYAVAGTLAAVALFGVVYLPVAAERRWKRRRERSAVVA